MKFRTRQVIVLLLFVSAALLAQITGEKPRPRARDLGLQIGILPTAPLNAITDVPGVLVGQTTLIRGQTIRTGVTAILPHGGNLFREKVPGAVFVGNGFGKLMGSTQIEELGEVETPILLTGTLNVPRVADALLDYILAMPGNEDVRSINPVIAETNDGFLNDVRGRHVGHDEVFAAVRAAQSGPVEEGSVGAGTGTVAFGFKGGIGTASRKLPANLGGFTVGVLVQTNYGGILRINGAPVGQELGHYFLQEELSSPAPTIGHKPQGSMSNLVDGSCIVVIATDAPLAARNLKRMAARAMMGLARTGSAGSNGSGDYAIAFSSVRSTAQKNRDQLEQTIVANDQMSPLFLAVIEATEEAVYNSLFRATTVTGSGHTVKALPLDRTLEILRRHNALAPSRPGD